jgi:dTDP-glucose 4,6-dehydratase
LEIRKLLVTGGAGFIGSNFIRYMFETYPDIEIINLDALTYAGNLDNLSGVADKYNYTFCHGDITDGNVVDSLLGIGVDAVVNFAAESHVDRSITDPSVFVRTNVLGTQVLLDGARKHGIKKYLQVSTDEVYGTLGKEGYFTEETPLAPNSPYSASKAGADMLVRAYHETFGLNVNITRCSNNYGPYQFPEKLIPLMVSNALEDKSLPVYGDGLNIRDWLYVEDHCRAIDTVLRNGISGRVYNIGGNNEKTNIVIVTLILEKLGKPKSLITFVKDRLGHDRRYAIDSSKIQKELGWSPKYNFEKGIEMTIDWYRSNQKWLDRIKTGEYRRG